MLPTITSLVCFPAAAAAAAKSLQSCPTLCNPTDSSPPGCPISGILQARTLEWVAISSSNAGKCRVKGKSLSRARLLVTPWTAAYQAPLSMGFSRQEYWNGVPLPSPWKELETLIVCLWERKQKYKVKRKQPKHIYTVANTPESWHSVTFSLHQASSSKWSIARMCSNVTKIFQQLFPKCGIRVCYMQYV